MVNYGTSPVLMGKSTIKGHAQQQTVCLPDGKLAAPTLMGLNGNMNIMYWELLGDGHPLRDARHALCTSLFSHG